MPLRLLKLNTTAKTFFALMITWSLFGLPATFLTTPASAEDTKPQSTTNHKPRAAYNALSLNFELNQGQTDPRVAFLTRSEGYVLFLTATEAVIALDNPATHRKRKEDRDRNDDFESSRQRPPRSIVRMK